ncbi:hypothetical protein FFLO_07006 [Filobasidium floriforme]|uniref:Uncharacterized protein n=1 Tax=Filobasidium floriforme TaxID=5210 RepID=A0A8K0JEA8_9TREE|nr:hypothetical protein FFLO_07006 [Filobasidium floriforme]
MSVSYTTWQRHNPPKPSAGSQPRSHRERTPFSDVSSPNLPNGTLNLGGSEHTPAPAPTFTNLLDDPADTVYEEYEGFDVDDGGSFALAGISDYRQDSEDELDLQGEEVDAEDMQDQPAPDWWGEDRYDDGEDDEGDDGLLRVPLAPGLGLVNEDGLLAWPDDRPRLEAEDLVKHHQLDAPLRHLFTTIAYGKATGMSYASANVQLDHMTTAVELATGEVLEGRTAQVKTALSRIGVNPDDLLTRYIVCPNVKCWNLVPYRQLYELPSVIAVT